MQLEDQRFETNIFKKPPATYGWVFQCLLADREVPKFTSKENKPGSALVSVRTNILNVS